MFCSQITEWQHEQWRLQSTKIIYKKREKKKDILINLHVPAIGEKATECNRNHSRVVFFFTVVVFTITATVETT